MGFTVQPGESAARGVRRLARGQVEKALAGLRGAGDGDSAEVVHAARKRLKKARAVVRLARGGLGRKVARRENARFRDAGRPLSAARDAKVLVETLDGLVERAGDPRVAELAGPVGALLRERLDEARRRVFGDDALRPGLVATLEAARRDVRRWEVAGHGWDALAEGLAWIYRHGRRAARAAADDPHPTDEALHEWRKRVKDLWSALEILRPLRPAAVQPRAAAAHALADRLGDDHDLAVLRQALAGPEALPVDPAAVAALEPLIAARRAELRRDALALGREVYAEPAGKFLARFGAYWEAWHAETEAAALDRA